ncbi:hypothetical protein SORBI_3005G118201 [Sorghum bicolor]|uniref:Uncharacterized protein n=1 Tax=Sorghum bicolor TaxID=4558 RepID=A0A1Z5RIT4_SORBI|nr:hypothetical protein SORBI_3005G118201 [Sorghum bicolor]
MVCNLLCSVSVSRTPELMHDMHVLCLTHDWFVREHNRSMVWTFSCHGTRSMDHCMRFRPGGHNFVIKFFCL